MKVNNFKTPIENIFFRSSKIGLIAGGLLKNDLTDLMREEKESLEAKLKEYQGITDLQKIQLKFWNKQKRKGIKLTPRNEAIRKRYTKQLTTFKTLTKKQQKRLDDYEYREGAEPELSVGAKSYIKEVWLWYEKGFKVLELTAKQVKKGKQGEEDAINLISFVDGMPYVNNNKKADHGRVYVKNHTGACDVNTYMKLIKKRVVDDCKVSWDPLTFMMSTYTTLEKWQGISYMYLYNADIFRLRRCLVDCPPEVLEDEYYAFRSKYKLTEKYIFDNDLLEQLKQRQISDKYPEVQELVEQFERNFLYEHSGNYTQEERVKTFTFIRDKELEEVLLKSIELAVEYYQTITLNMIE